MSAMKDDGERSSSGSYFRVVIPPQDSTGHEPRHIDFQPIPHAKIADAVASLQVKIEHTLTTLIMLFPKASARYDVYFGKLAGIAIAGIGQDQTQLGEMALETLKQEVIIRESGRIKNTYIRRLGFWAVGFAVFFSLLSIVGRYGRYPDWAESQREFFTLFAGSMIGTWLSFSIRKVELRFSELAIVETDQLDPPLRLLFVAGLTLFVGLILSTGLANVVIGGFNTASFLASSSSALLIGLVCGISEQRLSNTVATRATEIMTLLGRGSVSPSAPAADETT
ncbi:hypothetical protein HFO27_32815 [Rhizobium leguminosarum]|uniref:hypothetical protein n=1 Tax=Rhizobium leguminosarum TaxID=384 RepID=UPI001C9202F3|nr:hypothetical protein [Rhizobium leguminosarum]MBY3179326.1 hypothetical protein [Rhizobium leguminosarum]